MGTHKRKHQSKKKKIKVKTNRKNVVKKSRRKKKKIFSFYKFLTAVLVTLLLYVIIFSCFFSLKKVADYSMLPNLGNGDVVAVSRFEAIKRFDLVYLKLPGSEDYSVRRVIGLPGDEIVYLDDTLYVNQEGKPEKYLDQKKSRLRTMMLTEDFSLEELTGENVVPFDSYFVLGDNRKMSTDSRFFGYVPKESIMGKVDFKILPMSKNKLP